jgi:hypothetical protein
VYVIRPGSNGPLRIRFSFGALKRAEIPAASFALAQDDVVVVE